MMELTLKDNYVVPNPGPIIDTPIEVVENSIDSKVGISIEGNTVDITSEKAIANFVGKIPNSTVANPNIAKYGAGTMLLSPGHTNFKEIGLNGTSIDKIQTLNGQTQSCSTNYNTSMAQQLFSFNLLEEVKRKYGLTLTIEQLKKQIKKLTCRWYGYGSCPSGNKAYLTHFYIPTSEWKEAKPNTTNIPSLISHTLTTSNPAWADYIANAIDSNGFVHFLAYTDASDGVTASIIYTDYIELEIEMYPTLKSVGEDEGNKIGIVSCGKNLFNPSELANGSQNYIGPAKWIPPNGTTTRLTLKNLIRVKPNATYTLTVPNEYRGIIHQYDANLMPCGPDTGWVAGNKTHTMSSKTAFVNLYFTHYTGRNLTPDEVKNAVQFEEATSATTYEQYKESTATINLSEPLRGLPNGARDTIGSDNVLTRGVGKVILNGSEDWIRVSSTGVNTSRFDVKNILPNASNTSKIKILTSFFENGKTTSDNGDYEHARNSSNLPMDKDTLVIFINKNRLSEDSAVGLKKWLQSNNITVYYELDVPTTETVALTSVDIFEGGSIRVNTQIPAYITKLEYIRNLMYSDVEWLNPKLDWTSQDMYNCYDLNRVENNTLKIYLLMKHIVGSPNIEDVILDRDYSTIDFIDSLNRLERNIETLSSQLSLEGIRPSKTNWKVGDPFNYDDANRLETNLAILYPIILSNFDALNYCGTFSCGAEWEGGFY